MVDFSEIIKRIINIEDLSNEKDVAELFGFSAQNFSKRKKSGSLLPLFISWGVSKKVDLHWLLTGEGEMIRQGVENDTSIGKAGDPLGADPEVVDFLKMTRAVLESGTAYSDTLITNIRLSHHAMETEKRLKGFEKRLGKIEKTEKILKEKAARIREGDDEAERDAILKKRVACAN